MRYAIITALLFALGGCSGLIKPYIGSSTPRTVVVENAGFEPATAAQMAEQACQKYHLHAQLRLARNGDEAYDCVR